MSHTEKSYAALSSTAPLAPHTAVQCALRPDDLSIEFHNCGVCHTDVHNTRNDWGNANYPIVPGLGIIGKVLEVGPAFTRFKAGDMEAVVCMVGSCAT